MKPLVRAVLVLALAAIVPGAAAAGKSSGAPADDAGFEAYEEGDLARSIAAFTARAARGDPIAQYNLAVIRLRDESTATPLPVALRYLRESARQGFARAQHLLGTLYETGRHVERSQSLALHWFRKAAEQGLTDAQLALATQFYLGRGTTRDYAQAAHWYERAAEGGDVAAQYLIASMYEQGLGVARNSQAALDWYSAAARQGDPVARMKARAVAESIARERRL